MLTVEDKRNCLLSIKGWGICIDAGICNNITYLTRKEPNKRPLRSWLNLLMLETIEDLGYYSGDEVYPINPEYGDPIEAYLSYYEKGNLWDLTTSYGTRRMEIWQAMIKTIEAELQKQ